MTSLRRAKRLVAAWRVLIGVWGPRHWDLSISALSSYTKVEPPPPNPWLDQNKPRTPTPDPTNAKSGDSSAPKASESAGILAATPKRRKRLPSRRLIRHVLRARLVATQSLFTFLAEVERSGQNVRASLYLAKQFGGSYDPDAARPQNGEVDFLMTDGPKGWRGSREVFAFLRSRGAQIAALGEEDEGDWAAAPPSSGDDGAEDSAGTTEESEWAPPHSQ